MNRVFVICFGLMMISNYAASQYNLEIEISGIKNNASEKITLHYQKRDEIIYSLSLDRIF